MAIRVDSSSATQSSSVAQYSGYTVRRGDTLWKIAKAHDVSLKDLIKANPQIRNPDLIYPGQQINIPASSLSAASSAPVAEASHASRGKSSEQATAPVVNGGLSAATLAAQFKSAQPMLRYGSRGQAVSNLQSRLKELGFNPGPIDGIFGPKTEAAVRAFQRNQGITVDGIVGPQTWGKLNNPNAVSSTPSGPQAPTGTAENFVQHALAQEGDRYVYGAETNL
ncbi:MAG: SafA/ExsA family spore coat assembly protein, partial [Deltaproteobacteria bacterium]|nr:SafA/ExsA family spore coat assembly protein [Deltaproteobacteria bacterium]